MKTSKSLLPLLLFVATFPLNGLGQIKIDNGSYTPKVNDLKEVQITPNIPAYSELFAESMEETQGTEKPAYLNLKRNDWGASMKECVNPVGESVFIYSDNYPKRLFLNTKDKTAIVTSIPQGYYTIVGWFGRFDGNEDLRAEAIKAHQEMIEQYTFKTEYDSIWAICMLIDGWKGTDVDTWVDDYKARMRRLGDRITNAKNTGGYPEPEYGHYSGKYSIYVLEDQDGNLYYDFHDECGYRFESDDSHKDKYVSVTCYNKITELLLNKEVYVPMPSHDFITGEKLNDEDGMAADYFSCKDIFLRDGNLIGVFENEQGEITIKLDMYKCHRFDRIGYKGEVNGIYPKNYETLRENEIKLEQAQKETLVQKQKREKELAKEKRRKELVAKYGDNFGNLISNGKVAIGMTKEMCREAVGYYPTSQYKATTARGESEIWVYHVTNTKMTLYFDDGILYLIENKRY